MNPKTMNYLYSVTWDSPPTMRRVFLLDAHNMNEGATVESYLCQEEGGQKFTCSKDMYEETPEAAWAKYVEEQKVGVACIKDGLMEAARDLVRAEADLATGRAALEALGCLRSK